MRACVCVCVCVCVWQLKRPGLEPPVNTITERGDILQTPSPHSSPPPHLLSPSFLPFLSPLFLLPSLPLYPLDLHHTHSFCFTLLSFPTRTSWPSHTSWISPSSFLRAVLSISCPEAGLDSRQAKWWRQKEKKQMSPVGKQTKKGKKGWEDKREGAENQEAGSVD